MALEHIARGDTAQDQIARKIRVRLADMGGHSQAALARAMGVQPMWVSMRLNGTAQMTVNDLARFADALGVDMADLLPSKRRSAMPTAELSQTPTLVDALMSSATAPVAADLGVTTHPIGPLPTPTGQRRATVRTPPGFR